VCRRVAEDRWSLRRERKPGHIVGQLGGLALSRWVFSACLLTSTTRIPLSRRPTDRSGRKRVFLVAAVLFLVGSLPCGLTQSMPQLLLFRALHGRVPAVSYR
jgi:MFS family permease